MYDFPHVSSAPSPHGTAQPPASVSERLLPEIRIVT